MAGYVHLKRVSQFVEYFGIFCSQEGNFISQDFEAIAKM